MYYYYNRDERSNGYVYEENAREDAHCVADAEGVTVTIRNDDGMDVAYVYPGNFYVDFAYDIATGFATLDEAKAFADKIAGSVIPEDICVYSWDGTLVAYREIDYHEPDDDDKAREIIDMVDCFYEEWAAA